MAKEEEKIKLQEVQQPIVIEQRKETIGWIGYIQRPLNVRMQTRDRYLDGVIATKETQTIPSGTTTEIDWYTYTKTGDYGFTAWITNWVTIPENWTYMIIASFEWLENITTASVTHRVNIDTSVLYLQTISYDINLNEHKLFWLVNLQRWEVVNCDSYQLEWADKDIRVRLSITKLS